MRDEVGRNHEPSPSADLDPTDRPPIRFRSIVELLDHHGVRWIMTGSAMLAAYGADLMPNDLDVTPEF